MEFVLAYGGCCQCCGETRFDLLTLEHIRNKGYKLIYNNSSNLIRKLKIQGWPKGYTVLCFNCNMSTKNGAPCVHSKEYKNYKEQLEQSIKSDIMRDKYFKLKHQLG